MLSAGLGWGGSCFPKDVQALAFMAKEKGLEPRILNSVVQVNQGHRLAAVESLKRLINGSLRGTTIGMLGLAFKPNTDDMRDAPSVDIARALTEEGAIVHAFDPVATETARAVLPVVKFFKDPYEMATGCDALIVVTEWNEFKQLDLERLKSLLKRPVLYDGRNIYDPKIMRELGFVYRGVGRGYEVG
jgi:UDPglucose 6-dehydrogenase